MADTFDDPLEFTDEELRAALKRMGERARKQAFDAGLSIMVAQDDQLVRIYPDGSREIVGPIASPAHLDEVR